MTKHMLAVPALIALVGGTALGAEAAATVEAVDWVTVADASPFEGTSVSDVAVAPGGETVIVGRDAKTTSHRAGPIGPGEGRVWSSPDGSEWRSGELPDAPGAKPRRVIATQDGFVAIGWGRRPKSRKPGHGVIWTSRDGTDWSSEAFEGAEFTALDSVGDTVVVAGEQGETQTVWTSRAGGPWQPATVAPEGSGFTAQQIALSADGVYLVRDAETGRMYRSDDGQGFTSVDLPADVQPEVERGYIDALARVADGFALVVGRDDGSAGSWVSSDGREWRPGEALPGLAVGWIGSDLAAAHFVADTLASEGFLGFLQSDGTWCAVSFPGTDFEPTDLVWSEDGRLVVIGWQGRYGDPIIWQATGVRCGDVVA